MKGIGSWGKWVVVGLALLLMVGAASAQPRPTASGGSFGAPLGTGFTFQGRLSDAAGPVDAVCTLTFELYDSPGTGSPPTGGTLLGTDTQTGVPVNEGNFAVLLNEHGEFGANAFAGEARYLQIAVDCGNGPSTLSPRQALTATPYALYAVNASPDHSHWGQTWNGSGTGLILGGGTIGLSSTAEDFGVQGYGTGSVGTGVFGGGYIGVSGYSSAESGRGVYGEATASSGTAYGVYGQSESAAGIGVYGQALDTGGGNYGVAGYSPSTAGTGVFGWASANSGNTRGVTGRTDSPTGSGVYGHSRASSGESSGVFGQSASGDGRGVYGLATAASGEAYGVYGETDSSDLGAGVYGIGRVGVEGESASTSGRGVLGTSTASSGVAYGVYGQSRSASGAGVCGWANASGGSTNGVFGRSDSPDGHGVAGYATAAEGDASGVYGESAADNGTGVYGISRIGVQGHSTGEALGIGVYGQGGGAASFGVFGSSVGGIGVQGSGGSEGKGMVGIGKYGVTGQTAADDGYGVLGHNTANQGLAYGVYGLSDASSGTGVYGKGRLRGVLGHSDDDFGGFGVVGEAQGAGGTGVCGIASSESLDSVGVRGYTYSPAGRAVAGFAYAESGSATGVSGMSDSDQGRGVVGDATAESGTTYGVIGYSASPDGFAGYFRNTSSGMALRVQTDEGVGNIIAAYSGFGSYVFGVHRNGNVYAEGQYLNLGADYAEMLPGAARLEAGDVLVIGEEGQLERSTQPYQVTVAGVLSTAPGFVAGATEDSGDAEGLVPLAVMGVVPVKVSAENGCIRPGDLLASSATPGHAMRAGQDAPAGTIIGKALQGLDEGTGVIKMLVMLR